MRRERRYRKGNLDALAEARAICVSVRWRRMSDLYPSDDWLLDPGLAGKPVVIGLTNRTKSIAKKHDASQESLTIGFDAGRNRPAGLRTLDHDHAHTSLPETRICGLKGRPAGVRSRRCGLLGGHRTWGRCSSKGRLARDDTSPADRIPAWRILGIVSAFAATLNDCPTSTESFWEAPNNRRVEIPATSCG